MFRVLFRPMLNSNTGCLFFSIFFYQHNLGKTLPMIFSVMRFWDVLELLTQSGRDGVDVVCE